MDINGQVIVTVLVGLLALVLLGFLKKKKCKFFY